MHPSFGFPLGSPRHLQQCQDPQQSATCNQPQIRSHAFPPAGCYARSMPPQPNALACVASPAQNYSTWLPMSPTSPVRNHAPAMCCPLPSPPVLQRHKQVAVHEAALRQNPGMAATLALVYIQHWCWRPHRDHSRSSDMMVPHRSRNRKSSPDKRCRSTVYSPSLALYSCTSNLMTFSDGAALLLASMAPSPAISTS